MVPPARPAAGCPRWRGQFLPLGGLDGKLSPSFRREPVKLGATVVFGDTLLGRDPTPFDQPVQGRIKRALFHLKDLVRISLDCFCDGMAVRRARRQRTKNQQIQRPL